MMAQDGCAGGRGYGRCGGWLAVAIITLLGGPAARLAAADVEYRDFHIWVDQEFAGTYRMKIDNRDDGTVLVTGDANVTVKKWLFKYAYSYSGTETWKGERLLRLDSKSNDDGKKFAVTAAADGNNLRVKAVEQERNVHERVVPADSWTTTYWRLPEARLRNGPVPLLDCDTGKPIAGRMQYAGVSQVTVAGQAMNCAHYRLTGDKLQVELWYDGHNRLVRETTVEDGHKTLIHLAKIQH